MIAIVRLRGTVNVNEEIRRTLSQLHLPAPNSCTIIPDNPYYKGMVQKAKDYITWGELDKKGLEAISSRIETLEGKKNAKIDTKSILAGKALKELKLKPRIRLHPPRKGLKAVLHPYPDGDLGNRGPAINDLLKRMR